MSMRGLSAGISKESQSNWLLSTDWTHQELKNMLFWWRTHQIFPKWYELKIIDFWVFCNLRYLSYCNMDQWPIRKVRSRVTPDITWSSFLFPTQSLDSLDLSNHTNHTTLSSGLVIVRGDEFQLHSSGAVKSSGCQGWVSKRMGSQMWFHHSGISVAVWLLWSGKKCEMILQKYIMFQQMGQLQT